MKKRLTQDELDRVIAEVEHLARLREAELETEQVKQILQELNLPEDLLDEAMVQLHRREVLAVRQRRNRWIGVGIAVALVGAIALATVFIYNRQQAIADVSAYQNRLTLTQDDGSQLTVVDRKATPELFYRVTLQEAPMGRKLSLKCDWIDPSGQIAHQNRYQTQQIDKEVWPTHCRYQLSSAALQGTWKVQMSLGDRILSTTSFQVK